MRTRKAVGTLTMLGDTLQRRIDGGDSEVLLVCKSEPERIAALQKWFGIFLTCEQRAAIKGIASEIKEQTT
jgi:hypothetical protein